MKQAEDFRSESHSLGKILAPLAGSDFAMPTQFKGWTINDVLGHLHMFNVAAFLTLQGDGAFQDFFAPILKGLQAGQTLLQTQGPWLAGLSGCDLRDRWAETVERLADAYNGADPKQRVAWAGPDMSALSSITARQMETWAHGQEVFDILGKERLESDRIRNIAHLGVATFGWTFKNRRLEIPHPAPHVTLTAPSGEIWTWNEPQANNAVRGSAVDFARVVTQVRNIGDTSLVTTGRVARRWMEIAQCFAGAPQTPPAAGARHMNAL